MHIIGGIFKKKKLASPKTEKVRPTTSQLREALFNICQHSIKDSKFLDLFAGSGAIGLEALSRGAQQATFVENNRIALAAIKQNIAALNVEKQTIVYNCDIFKALQKLHDNKETFDIIYADPPYGQQFGCFVLEFIDKHSLLNENGVVFIEETALDTRSLHNLYLHSQRRIGRAHLYEYHLRDINPIEK